MEITPREQIVAMKSTKVSEHRKNASFDRAKKKTKVGSITCMARLAIAIQRQNCAKHLQDYRINTQLTIMKPIVGM